MSECAYALVTGASSGIGAALARELAARGRPLILTARRLDRLQSLADELKPKVACVCIAADLADPAAPEQLWLACQDQSLRVDLLVNNAGYGVPGRYLSSDWKSHADFLQVMVTAVCELTHRFLPGMESAGRGGVLNIASMAGLVPSSAGHTLYAASKSFMIKFSESLALESGPRGVKVTALCPGFTYSEFHDVTGTRAQMAGMSKAMWLQADDVARQGLDALEAGTLMCIPGWRYRMIRRLTKLLPDSLALAMVNRRSKDFRNQE